ncbi:hypothetical protein [Streptomyces sp. NPDC090445]|uniref:hypothetical protein n=1 Tax=Streptomyces sp. NPDC090445 TaxID=3365963 RepID=UPI00381B762C
MHTSTTRSVAVATAAVLCAVFAAGCRSGAEPLDPPAPSAPASAAASPFSSGAFDKAAAQADLDAAVTVAGGAPAGTGDGLPTPTSSDDPPATDTERKREEVVARVAACSVAWSSDGMSARGQADTAETQRQFHAVLPELARLGWQETRAIEKVPVGEKESMISTNYKKQGWTLIVRHTEMGLFSMVTITGTEDACAERFTDEELALLED